MSRSAEIYLDPASTRRWTREIERLFRTARGGKFRTDTDVAGAMAEALDDGTGEAVGRYKPELSRFKTGKPDVLRRWLGTKRKTRLEPLAEVLGVPPDWFDGLLRRVQPLDGEEAGAVWHPAFPDLQQGDVHVPARLVVREALSVVDLAYRYAAHLEESEDRPPWLWVVGPGGSGRRSAARQLSDRLPAAAVLLGEPPEGWTAARRAGSGPVVTVADHRPDSPDATEDWTATVLPWGVAELQAVVEELVRLDALDAAEAERCRGFARRVLDEPAWQEELGRPYAVIQLVRDVADGGEPDGPVDLRRRRTAVAWSRALGAAPSERLEALGEPLLERLWSACLALPAGGHAWTELDMATAVQLLSEAGSSRPAPADGRAGFAKLDALLDATRRADRARLGKELRELMAARPGEALLSALLEAGLLRAGERDHVAAHDPDLAVLWAARGVAAARRLDLSQCWERLAEPGWLELARELALAGLGGWAFADALGQVPDWAAVDAARGLVVFAAFARSEEDPLAEDLVPAWAGALWSLVHAAYEARVSLVWEETDRPPELALLGRSLVAVSRRHAGLLPWLDPSDPLAGLAALVPDAIRRAAGAWRPVPTDETSSPSPRSPYRWDDTPPSPTVDWKDRWAPAELVRRLAPYQFLPLSDSDHRPFSGWGRPPSDWGWPWEALARAAEVGHENAQQLLAGCDVRRGGDDVPPDADWDDWLVPPIADRETYKRWACLPARLRLRWAGRVGAVDADAWWRLGEIARHFWPREADGPANDGLVDEAVAALRRLGADEARRRLAARVAPEPDQTTLHLFPSLPLTLRIAERLEAVEALKGLLELPARWLDGLRVRRIGGGAVLARRHVLAEDDGTESVHWSAVGDWTGREAPQADWTELEERHALALAAAEALHRLGHAEALRAIWRTGASWALPERLLADAGRIAVLDAARRPPTADRLAAEPPLPALRLLATDWPRLAEKGVPFGCEPVALQAHRATNALRSASEPAQLVDAALDALHVVLPDELPEEVEGWLTRLAERQPPDREPACLRAAVELREGTSVRAGERLLDLADDEPLRWWLDRPEAPAGARERKRHDDMARLVGEGIRQSADLLDRVWSLASAGPVRLRLLHLAAPPPKATDDPPTWLPRPWWGEAMAAGELAELRFWARHCADSPAVAPALRRLAVAAAGAREQAAHAILLHRHEPWCPELVQALRSWLCEAPDLLVGPDRLRVIERWVEGRYDRRELVSCAGGAADFLALLNELADRERPAWLVRGARRAWQHLLDGKLQEGGGLPAFETHVEDWHPGTDVLRYRGHDVVRELCDLLAKLGDGARVEAVLWGESATDAASRAALPERIRERILWAWLRHASPDRLLEVVRRGGVGRVEAARHLAASRAPGLAAWVEAELAAPEPAIEPDELLCLLHDAAPDRLPEHARRVLASREEDRPRWLALLALLAGAGGPAAGPLRVLLRRWSLTGAGPQEAGRPESRGTRRASTTAR